MNKPLISNWVVDYIAVFLVTLFGAIVATGLALAWNQVVWNLDNPNNYASEYTGILNSLIMFGMGVFFSSVVGKLFGIKQEEIKANVDQAVKTSKDIGLSAVAEQHDKLQESPKIDEEGK